MKNFIFKEYSNDYSSGISGENTHSSGDESSSPNSALDFTKEAPAPRHQVPRRIQEERGRLKSKATDSKMSSTRRSLKQLNNKSKKAPTSKNKEAHTIKSKDSDNELLPAKISHYSLQERIKTWNNTNGMSDKKSSVIREEIDLQYRKNNDSS
jgi:hypothetical protein